MLVVAVGLGAAFLLGLGFVIQQHAAAQAPAEERLSIRLLIDLAHRPIWLGGIAAMVGGQMLGGFALGKGSLTLIEPLLTCNVLFALPMAAAWQRRHLSLREWAGSVILIGGLSGFVAAAGPGGRLASRVLSSGWLEAGLSIVVVVGVLTWFAKRSNLGEEATLLAVGAGVLYGLQDGLTQRILLLFRHGWFHLVISWEPYALVAVAIAGLVLAQSAFEAAPLTASLPALTIAEPICGIGLGAGLFGAHIRLGGIFLGSELAAIALMVVGVLMVARSPIVCGEVEHG